MTIEFVGLSVVFGVLLLAKVGLLVADLKPAFVRVRATGRSGQRALTRRHMAVCD